jgi:hypothetical protein
VAAAPARRVANRYALRRLLDDTARTELPVLQVTMETWRPVTFAGTSVSGSRKADMLSVRILCTNHLPYMSA